MQQLFVGILLVNTSRGGTFLTVNIFVNCEKMLRLDIDSQSGTLTV